MKLKFTITIVLLFCIVHTSALYLPKVKNIGPIGRQDDSGDEDTAAATATELSTNNHLIGTLAGVLSSILRSGVNGTNPFKFNLTEVVKRVQNINFLPRLPIRLPFPGLFAVQSNKIDLPAPKNDSAPQYENIIIPAKNLKKKIIYRNPSKPSGVLNALRESQIQPSFGDDYDEISTTKETSIWEEDELKATTAATNIDKYTTYPAVEDISTTTEEYSLKVLQKLQMQARVTEKKAGLQEVTSSLSHYTTESSFQIPDIDIMLFWVGLYLNPAAKIVTDAAKTVNFNVSDVIGGATAGVNEVVNVIPKFTEALTNFVGYVGTEISQPK